MGWLGNIALSNKEIVKTAERSALWEAVEQNFVASSLFPSRSMTILRPTDETQHVKQHRDTGDCVEGCAITWLQTYPFHGRPSVYGQYFWISAAGVRILVRNGVLVWHQTTVLRHGTAGGATYAHPDAMRIGMAFYAKKRIVSVYNTALLNDPNVQAKPSVGGFRGENLCMKEPSGGDGRSAKRKLATAEANASIAVAKVHATRSKSAKKAK